MTWPVDPNAPQPREPLTLTDEEVKDRVSMCRCGFLPWYLNEACPLHTDAFNNLVGMRRQVRLGVLTGDTAPVEEATHE